MRHRRRSHVGGRRVRPRPPAFRTRPARFASPSLHDPRVECAGYSPMTSGLLICSVSSRCAHIPLAILSASEKGRGASAQDIPWLYHSFFLYSKDAMTAAPISQKSRRFITSVLSKAGLSELILRTRSQASVESGTLRTPEFSSTAKSKTATKRSAAIGDGTCIHQGSSVAVTPRREGSSRVSRCCRRRES